MRVRAGLFIFAVWMGLATNAYAQATITVNATADNATAGDGSCTLREAITNANVDLDLTSGDCAAGSGTDTIAFNIPGAGPHTIQPLSALPDISDPILIDGLTQPGADCASWPPTLQIELDSNQAPTA